MAAEVLAAGARSIFLDLEPWHGYWQVTPEDAKLFGEELRRLQPHGIVVTVVEPRPWALKKLPSPSSPHSATRSRPSSTGRRSSLGPNLKLYEDYGWPPGPGGITPEFLLDVSAELLQQYHLPI